MGEWKNKRAELREEEENKIITQNKTKKTQITKVKKLFKKKKSITESTTVKAKHVCHIKECRWSKFIY